MKEKIKQDYANRQEKLEIKPPSLLERVVVSALFFGVFLLIMSANDFNFSLMGW